MKESSSQHTHERSEFTPGPWVLDWETGHVISKHSKEAGKIVCTMPGTNAEGYREANARLIAAAPHLLQMLEEIASLQIDVPGYNSPSALLLRLAHMQSLARGGIEKAKGTP